MIESRESAGFSSDGPKLNTAKQNMQDSNPFKINVNSIDSNPFQAHMEESNPFQIGIGQNNQPALFLGKQQSQSEPNDDIFHQIIQKSERENLYKVPSFVPKITKTQSKIEGIHIQQNVKKYKDILRGLYNDKYWKKAKNFEDSWKRLKKDSSNQNISQQIRKPDACFKANRLVFNKENKTKTNLYQKIEEYYLVRHSRERKELIIYELKQPNINYLKPVIMKSSADQDIAHSVEYDMLYGRLFYFSNSRQQLVVISTKDKEVICRVKTKCQRINPLLHINKYKSSLYLLIIGGYRILNESIVEGCKYIEIFSIDKWEVSLKQVVLKLGIGRICPIIFSCDHQKEPSVFILGGCSNASLSRKKQIVFNIDEDINFSTNQTAVRIQSSFIEDCFLSDDQNNSLLINNMNVRFDNPLQLYGGYVLFRKLAKAEKLELFLSRKKQIYTIKTLKNDVHIIESELALATELKGEVDGSINRSIGYHRDFSNMFQLYQIDRHGKLCLQSVHINQKKNKSKQNQIQCIIM